MRKLISYLLLFTILGSSVVWANNGQLDEFIDQTVAAAVAQTDTGTIDHPPCDHSGHFSAHMLGLDGATWPQRMTQGSPVYPLPDAHFDSRRLAPPAKPPRA